MFLLFSDGLGWEATFSSGLPGRRLPPGWREGCREGACLETGPRLRYMGGAGACLTNTGSSAGGRFTHCLHCLYSSTTPPWHSVLSSTWGAILDTVPLSTNTHLTAAVYIRVLLPPGTIQTVGWGLPSDAIGVNFHAVPGCLGI